MSATVWLESSRATRLAWPPNAVTPSVLVLRLPVAPIGQ
jgi:hypothetical protein